MQMLAKTMHQLIDAVIQEGHTWHLTLQWYTYPFGCKIEPNNISLPTIQGSSLKLGSNKARTAMINGKKPGQTISYVWQTKSAHFVSTMTSNYCLHNLWCFKWSDVYHFPITNCLTFQDLFGTHFWPTKQWVPPPVTITTLISETNFLHVQQDLWLTTPLLQHKTKWFIMLHSWRQWSHFKDVCHMLPKLARQIEHPIFILVQQFNLLNSLFAFDQTSSL
jgi:hypothetical protein